MMSIAFVNGHRVPMQATRLVRPHNSTSSAFPHLGAGDFDRRGLIRLPLASPVDFSSSSHGVPCGAPRQEDHPVG